MPRGTERIKGRRAGVRKAGLAKKEKFVEACAEGGRAKKTVKPPLAKAPPEPKKWIVPKNIPFEKLSPRQRAEAMFQSCLENLQRKSIEAYEKARKGQR